MTGTIHLEEGVAAPELREDASGYVLQLDYYRFKNLVDIRPTEGSVFVRAHTEPFNTEMELSEERLINWLRHFHINQHVGHLPITVHASGHASGPEILEMIRKIKPKQLYPVHTEKPQAFTELSSTCEVVFPQKT